MIYLTAIGLPPSAVVQYSTVQYSTVQYTFTHKQYIEQHNRHKQYLSPEQCWL